MERFLQTVFVFVITGRRELFWGEEAHVKLNECAKRIKHILVS